MSEYIFCSLIIPHGVHKKVIEYLVDSGEYSRKQNVIHDVLKKQVLEKQHRRDAERYHGDRAVPEGASERRVCQQSAHTA